MGEGDGGQVEWLDELVGSVRELHELMLQIGGGVPGEHSSSLYAACARPFYSAFGEFIYKDPYERAAAIFHAIICDHAFVDGNKRTGTAAALLMLADGHALPESDHGGKRLRLTLLGQAALATASGALDAKQVLAWVHRIFDPLPD